MDDADVMVIFGLLIMFVEAIDGSVLSICLGVQSPLFANLKELCELIVSPITLTQESPEFWLCDIACVNFQFSGWLRFWFVFWRRVSDVTILWLTLLLA